MFDTHAWIRHLNATRILKAIFWVMSFLCAYYGLEGNMQLSFWVSLNSRIIRPQRVTEHQII